MSGLIGIPLLLILVFVKEGFPFIIAVGLMSLIALNEFYRGIRRTGADPQEWVGLCSAVLFLYAACHEFKEWFRLPAVLSLFVVATLSYEMVRKNRNPIKNIGSTFLGVVYVGWLFSYLVALRSIQGVVHPDGIHWTVSTGAWMVLYVVFVAWAADSGAYFVGRKFGKHKLTPVLSPNKSWEGAIAGLVSAVVMSGLMGHTIGISWINIVIIGIGICIVSIIGDLAESSIKRDIGIKDFGGILPGHGGILDRFDGLLFAAPLFYYYIKLFLGY